MSNWRVLVEHEYDQGDIADPRHGDHVWLKDSAGRPLLVKVREVLPAERAGDTGTLIAEPLSQ